MQFAKRLIILTLPFPLLLLLSACGYNRAAITLPNGAKTEFTMYNNDASASGTFADGSTFTWSSNPNEASTTAMLQVLIEALQRMPPAQIP